MQLRCTFCQTMYAISRDDMLAALEHLTEEKLKYYDAHCPKCRRANRVERLKLELAYPNWKADLKTMAKTALAAEEKPAASPAKPKVPATTAKPAAKPAAGAAKPKAPAAAKPAAKPASGAAKPKAPAAVKKK
jgi:hypothetical protein